jgi:uncharacterized protein YndB with AHSA1/START domain
MNATRKSEPIPMKNRTTLERTSDREVVITRTFNGPPRLVFEAWSKPELFQRWWIPKSLGMTVHSCEMDVRVGGTYRLMISHGASEPMAFHGKYLEVTPHSRLAWTNEESGGDGSITTVTFEDQDGKTLVVVHELHPSKEAFDANAGAEAAMPEAFEQLDELLAQLR